MSRNRRLHIAHLSMQLPDRAGGGGATRQFHLLRELARDFEVTVLAGTAGGPHPQPAVQELESFCALSAVEPLPWSTNPARRARRATAIALSRPPYEAARYDPLTEPMRQALRTLHPTPHVVWTEPSNVAAWQRLAPHGAKRVVGFHDILGELLREASALQRQPARRLLAEVEWRRMRRHEAREAAVADLCVVVSERDCELLAKAAPQASIAVVPNGVDVVGLRPDPAGPPEDEDVILFTGSLNHPPNERAALRLAREVLPRLKELRPSARLRIVGRGSGPAIRALGELPGVEVVGEVPDMRPYFLRGMVTVAPIEFGSGSRLKILEALAMERPMLATPKAAEGLDLRDGKELLIRPLGEFPQVLVELFDDPMRRRALGVAGRAAVVERYAWPRLGELLAAQLREMCTRGAAG
jgi:glycosyltransferase involved in cell wall biosynthesis